MTLKKCFTELLTEEQPSDRLIGIVHGSRLKVHGKNMKKINRNKVGTTTVNGQLGTVN